MCVRAYVSEAKGHQIYIIYLRTPYKHWIVAGEREKPCLR